MKLIFSIILVSQDAEKSFAMSEICFRFDDFRQFLVSK